MNTIIEKIRAEIIKRIDKRRLSEQAKNEFVSLLHFLDTLKEQPVCEDASKEKSLSLQIYAYLNTCSDELYAEGKPLYSEYRQKEIHDCMAMWKKLHDYFFYNKPYQPVCEELGKEMDRFFTSKEYEKAKKAGFGEAHAARHFAEWQEQQDKETIELAEDHAYLAGAVNEREKLMKEAGEAVIYQVSETESRIWYPLNVKQYKEGDKVKIIIIKED